MDSTPGNFEAVDLLVMGDEYLPLPKWMLVKGIATRPGMDEPVRQVVVKEG